MKTKLPYSLAHPIAETVMIDLAPECERIEIAGSLRRRKAEVGDIEICVISDTVTVPDLFGFPVEQVKTLYLHLDKMAERRGWKLLKGGQKYRQYDLGPICLDLFITTPECWGVIFALRTGCAEFSHWLVTDRQHNGACPSNLKVKEGQVWRGDEALDTPEERALFDLLGVQWIEPEYRSLDYRRMWRTL